MTARGTLLSEIDSFSQKVKHLSFPGTCVSARASVTRLRVGGGRFSFVC